MSFQSIAWQLMSEEDYGAYIEEKPMEDPIVMMLMFIVCIILWCIVFAFGD